MSFAPKSLSLPLRVLAVLVLAAPTLVFLHSTWQNYASIWSQADERIERSLDILQEHALKSFQTVERAISEVNEVLRGLTDDDIRNAQSDLYLRLKRTQQALPQIESIWVFDKVGHPLLSSTILPVPRDLNNADRSYFKTQVTADNGLFVSELLRARIGSLTFFVASARRPTNKGDFNGIVALTLLPSHFSEFFRKLSRGNDTFALLRLDGTELARFPDQHSSVSANGNDLTAPLAGTGTVFATAVSARDNVERRLAYRRVPDFPIYVVAGVSTWAVASEFYELVLTQFIFGAPLVAGIFALVLFALQSAQRFHAEVMKRESAENALRHAQRLEALGQLTGGVAHDFNNLLMIVSGGARRLKEVGEKDPKAKSALDAIDTAVKRGAALTRQLLTFSRRQPYEAVVVDLQQQIPVIAEMLKPSLRGDILMELKLSPELWPTKIDVSEFELAILNLAINARDAMPSGGNITISASNIEAGDNLPVGLAGDFVIVSVMDTGIGIDPQHLPRVFEPFFTTKSVDKGTGLGLSQVYGFTKQSGGTATVRSESGHGTIVSMYLPRSKEHPASASASIAPATANFPRNGTVLLVEDNQAVADVTRMNLQDLGYSVESFASAADAKRHIASSHKKYFAMLTDIVMPGPMSGIDLAEWTRAHVPNLPVILATGYSAKTAEAISKGFVVLRKPYDQDKLDEALRQAVANKT